jgi:hypothetical protein
MTSDKYWEMFHLIRGDIESAIASHTAYFKIHGLGADRNVLQKYNRSPKFWQLNVHALQTTFFISLGRVFDKRKDAWSIYDLLENTVEHVGWFSKAALRERKRADVSRGGKDPDWLDGYIANAWEPSRKDLEALRYAIVPYAETFNRYFQPIRHSHFAHSGKVSAEDVSELFGKTKIGDATDITRFLYTLIFEVWEIYLNGRKPDLTNYREYDVYVKNLNDQIEKLVLGLP